MPKQKFKIYKITLPVININNHQKVLGFGL
jgi:hypothetical protein